MKRHLLAAAAVVLLAACGSISGPDLEPASSNQPSPEGGAGTHGTCTADDAAQDDPLADHDDTVACPPYTDAAELVRGQEVRIRHDARRRAGPGTAER
jgi:hypothetical protein